MRRYLVLFLLFAILTAAAGAIVSADIPPTWPKPFSLYAGKTAKFTFEVTRPGQIVVDVTWQGCKLATALADPSGKLVNTPALQSSPVKVTYAATATDVQKGIQWSVTIGSPPAAAPSQNPVATGQVDVHVPAALITPGLQGQVVVPSIPPELLLPPSIQSVTPAFGSPTDVVIIKGKNTPTDKTKVEAWFTLSTNATAKGTIANATKAQDVISYEVRVPGNDLLHARYDGKVYLKIKGMSDPTNSLVFHFDPCPQPVINKCSPSYGGSGWQMNFYGYRFRPDDKVYFMVSGSREAGINKIFLNDTHFIVTMPQYPTGTTTASVYAERMCGGLPVRGKEFIFPISMK